MALRRSGYSNTVGFVVSNLGLKSVLSITLRACSPILFRLSLHGALVIQACWLTVQRVHQYREFACDR
jgi:hypothetical protein